MLVFSFTLVLIVTTYDRYYTYRFKHCLHPHCRRYYPYQPSIKGMEQLGGLILLPGTFVVE